MAAGVQSVVKATQILGAFDRSCRRMTIREVAAKTGIPRSTVHDLCRALVSSKLLDAMPDGGLQLGIGLAMLGGQVTERLGLVDAVQHPIRQHLDIFGAEVHLAVYTPGAVFYVFRKRALTRASTLNRTGRSWAIHTTGCGRAILATMAPAARERELSPLVTDVDRTQLELECSRFRRDGYLVTNVSQPRLTSVAAPIYGQTGLAVGAIGVGDLTHSMTRSRIASIGDAVRAAAIATGRSVA